MQQGTNMQGGVVQYGQSNPNGGGAPPAYQGQPQPYGQAQPAQPQQQQLYQQGGAPAGSYDPAADAQRSPPQQSIKSVDVGDKFKEQTQYRDWPWAVLFAISLVVVVVIAIANASNQSSDNTANTAAIANNSDVQTAFLILVVSALIAGGVAALWMVIMKAFAKQLIWTMFIVGIVANFVFGILFILLGSLFLGILFIVAGVITLVLFKYYKRRIPFSTALLVSVTGMVQKYPSTVTIAYFSIFLQVAWALLWVFAYVVSTSSNSFISQVLLLLIFYWTSQVIKDVVHVTSSGTFATHYFLANTDQMPGHPVRDSFKRAVTTSFGSICLGALIVATIKTIRAVLRSLRNQENGLLVCFIDMCLGCIENLVEYFNHYAFTYVAIYGMPFCEAAKSVWSLLTEHFLDIIIQDNLIGGVLILGCFLGGVLVCLVGVFWSLSALPNAVVLMGFICFIIGFVTVAIVSEVVESGTATIFVCYAEDPNGLRKSDPALYDQFQQALSNAQA